MTPRASENDDLRCPRCRVALAGRACPKCRGVAVNLALLRQFAPPERVKRLWIALDDGKPGDPCPSCARPLAVVAPYGERTVAIAGCKRCQLVWFDADDLKAFSPGRQKPPPREGHLSPRAAEALVKAEIARERLGDDCDRDVARVELAVRCVLAALRSM